MRRNDPLATLLQRTRLLYFAPFFVRADSPQ
jgi:hypothetical protein